MVDSKISRSVTLIKRDFGLSAMKKAQEEYEKERMDELANTNQKELRGPILRTLRRLNGKEDYR